MQSDDITAKWNEVLAQLKLQMTVSTFGQLFAGSMCGGVNSDGQLVVALRSDHAVEWVESRLSRVVLDTAVRVFDGDVFKGILYVVNPGRSVPHEEERPSGEFVGFESYQSNFTQTPKQFFEIVVPLGPPSVTAFVAAVINHTIGHIVNFHTYERREWWEASYPMIGEAAGLSSRASIAKAIRFSITLGYVVRGRGEFDLKYRLRRVGEPIQEFEDVVEK